MAGLKWVPGVGVVWQTDVQQDIKATHNPFTPSYTAFRFLADDGTDDEGGDATALQNQDVDHTLDLSSGDVIILMRCRIQETGGDANGSGRVANFQYEINDSGTWNDLTETSTEIDFSDGTSTLTDNSNDVSTERCTTGGSGSFIAGAGNTQDTTGSSTGDINYAAGANLTAGDRCELAIALRFFAAEFSNGDTVDFRMREGSSASPTNVIGTRGRITVSKGNAETVAATMTGSATVSKVATFFQTLAATLIGTATVAKVATFFRTVAATMTGSAAIAVAKMVSETIAATMTGSAAVAFVKSVTRALAATLVGAATTTFTRPLTNLTLAATNIASATVNKVASFFRTVAATMTGVATTTFTRPFTQLTVSATNAASAVLAKTLSLFRTLAATMTGSAVLAFVKSVSRTLAATMTGAAVVNKTATFFRTVAATMVGVATTAFTRPFTQLALAASNTGVAVLNRLATFFRTLAATMTGVATLANPVTTFVTLAATMVGNAAVAFTRPFTSISLSATNIGNAAISRLVTFFRTIEATMAGSASLTTDQEAAAGVIVVPNRPGFTHVKPPLTLTRGDGWDWFWEHCIGAYFPHNEDIVHRDGAVIRDRSRYGATATVDNASGTIEREITKQGRSFVFTGDATTDRIDLGSITPNHPLGRVGGGKEIGIVTGFRWDGGETNNFPRLIDKSDAGSTANGWGIWYDVSGTDINMVINDGGQSTVKHEISLVAGQDYHFGAAVYDPDAASVENQGQWYRDGVRVATANAGHVASIFPTTTTNAAIGNWNHSTDREWAGAIHYVYVFDIAPPDEFFRQIYEDPYGPFRRRSKETVIITGAAGPSLTQLTIAAINATSAAVSRVASLFRTLAATVTGNATVTAGRLFTQLTNAATMVGNAAVAFTRPFTQLTLAATMVGNAVVNFFTAGAVTLAATMTAVATTSFSRPFSNITVAATLIGNATATFRRLFTQLTLAAKMGSIAQNAEFIRFDGTSTFVEWSTGPSTAIDGKQATISIPFNPRGGEVAECIFYIGTTTGESIFIGFNSNRNLVARISDGAATPQLITELVSQDTYSDNNNYTATFSFDLENDNYWLYVNGVDTRNQTDPADGDMSVTGASPSFQVTIAATANATPNIRNRTVESNNVDFTDTWRFGSTDDSSDRQWFSGSTGHVYVELAYYAPENAGQFYSIEHSAPSEHGSDGSNFTNVQPELYWVPTTDDVTVNNGTGGNADSASLFSDESGEPIKLINNAKIARTATFFRTLAATMAGAGVLSRLVTFFRTLAATMIGSATVTAGRLFTQLTLAATHIGIATVNRVATFFRTLAATMVGVASIIADAANAVTLAATMVGNATLNRTLSLFRTLAATMIGSAAISRVATFFRTIAATMIGVATVVANALGGGLEQVTLAATATMNATVNRVATLFRTVAATMVGNATVQKIATFLQTVAATMVGIATVQTVAIFPRAIAATMTGVATLNRQLSLFRTLAATMTGNAAVVVGRLFTQLTLAATNTVSVSLTRVASLFRTLAATMTGVASTTATQIFALTAVTLAATMTGLATIATAVTRFVEPFTGHGGLGLGDARTRWTRRVGTWRRRR